MYILSLGSGSDVNAPSVIEKKFEEHAQLDHSNLIPIVGLLVQGSPKNIDHVLFYVQNRMPVVVLKGSGGLADVISYVYEEILEK